MTLQVASRNEVKNGNLFIRYYYYSYRDADNIKTDSDYEQLYGFAIQVFDNGHLIAFYNL